MNAENVVKYILEGLAVSVASHLVSKNRLNFKEIALLGVTAALVFMVLDQFSPAVSAGARQGSGFGIGYKMVGGGCGCADQNGGSCPMPLNRSEEQSAQPAQPQPAQPAPEESEVEAFRPYR